MIEEEKKGYQNLLIKFFTGEISDSEIILLKAWLDRDPENRRCFNEENEVWQAANAHNKFEHYKTDTAWVNISSKLGIRKQIGKSYPILSKNNFRILIAAAAVACLVTIGSLSLIIAGKTFSQQIADASTMVTTNNGEKAHIFLADSTEVILNSESKLQYNGNFNITDRTVKLTGEAFFDVSTNPEKPFVVQLDQMKISAIGTRFNVFSFGNEDRVETTLEEGAITLSIKGKEPINLKSGQQVVYFVRTEKILVRDVAVDTYTSWKENKLRFYDTPFKEVLRRIGRKYNVIFEVTNRDLLDLKYTATFIDEPIEEVMHMLKTVSPLTYKIYNRTSINDKHYLNPKIVVGKR
ncbi:MAG TPA: FecR domain-containing protein [Bacteroidales bacterium]|nr:FecR domain-containing protein [Bacteroidales bacterium]